MKITDQYIAKTTLSPIIFRNKLADQIKFAEKHNQESDVVFCYLFLQIYIESFLHNSMRQFIRLEDPAGKGMSKNWNEKLYIQDSNSGKEGKISKLLKLFDLSNDQEAKNLKIQICSNFTSLTKIRNDIAHGHEISTIYSSKDGKQENSLRKQLKFNVFKYVLEKANEVGNGWNGLIKLLHKNCKSIKRIDMFEFENIEYNRQI